MGMYIIGPVYLLYLQDVINLFISFIMHLICIYLYNVIFTPFWNPISYQSLVRFSWYPYQKNSQIQSVDLPNIMLIESTIRKLYSNKNTCKANTSKQPLRSSVFEVCWSCNDVMLVIILLHVLALSAWLILCESQVFLLRVYKTDI